MALYVDATGPTGNIRAIFQCICHAGLNQTIEKCKFGVREVDFLMITVLSEGVPPQTHKNQNFLIKMGFFLSKKALQRHLASINY